MCVPQYLEHRYLSKNVTLSQAKHCSRDEKKLTVTVSLNILFSWIDSRISFLSIFFLHTDSSFSVLKLSTITIKNLLLLLLLVSMNVLLLAYICINTWETSNVYGASTTLKQQLNNSTYLKLIALAVFASHLIISGPFKSDASLLWWRFLWWTLPKS